MKPYAPLDATALRTRYAAGRRDFTRAALAGRDLTEVDLSGACLRGADLGRATLTRATLRGVDLSMADLSGARFDGALLDGARLDGAVLFETDLRGASLAGATLDLALLERTRLLDARVDPDTRFDAATVRDLPTVPPSFAEALARPAELARREDAWWRERVGLPGELVWLRVVGGWPGSTTVMHPDGRIWSIDDTGRDASAPAFGPPPRPPMPGTGLRSGRTSSAAVEAILRASVALDGAPYPLVPDEVAPTVVLLHRQARRPVTVSTRARRADPRFGELLVAIEEATRGMESFRMPPLPSYRGAGTSPPGLR